MDPTVLAEFEAARWRTRERRAAIQRYRRPGLLLGGTVAFLFGGFLAVGLACLLLVISRAVGMRERAA